tara:strand:- start:1121 stop:2329 length:1209 start_codon:yes stop_codon:yes gene_type:complete
MSSNKKLLSSASGYNNLDSSSPAKYLITHNFKVYDISNNYSDVTSTFFSGSFPSSWAGSSERLHHGWQDNGYRSKYIGFGAWGKNAAVGGAILNIDNAGGSGNYWTATSNYDGTSYTIGSTGNAIATVLAPQGNSGDYFWYHVNDNENSGVAQISTGTNQTGEWSELEDTGAINVATWGNYIAVANEDNTDISIGAFNTNGTSSGDRDSDSLPSSFNNKGAIKVSKGGNVIAVASGSVNNNTGLYVYTGANIADYNGSSTSLSSNRTIVNVIPSSETGNVTSDNLEAIGISDDEKYIAVAYRLYYTPFFGISIIDIDNSFSVSKVSTPAGAGSNCRHRDIVWYPDNDTFFCAGYADAPNIECKQSTLSTSKNLDNHGTNSLSLITSSLMGATVLPDDWQDGF